MTTLIWSGLKNGWQPTATFENLKYIIMSKYKLTTDLIKDCVALIPQNWERLNKSKKYNVRPIFEPNPNKFGVVISEPYWKVYVEWILTDVDDYKKIRTNGQIIVDKFVRDCLRTIPEFQGENPQIKKEFQKRGLNKISFGGKNPQLARLQFAYWRQNQPKTIASATLHGQGEYPPSTLEELCESYKKVLKNNK